jgi:hypothetical protein
MPEEPTAPTHQLFGQVKTVVPSCAADDDELARQAERQAELAPSVSRCEREGDAVVVEFETPFARRALEDLIEVERRCCPFFVFDFDEKRRRLEVRVRDRAQLPALNAIAALLGTPAKRPS